MNAIITVDEIQAFQWQIWKKNGFNMTKWQMQVYEFYHNCHLLILFK